MTDQELEARLYEFIRTSYPDIKIEVKAGEGEDKRRHIYFTEDKFKHLYPFQRYHYLLHKIPEDFFLKNLVDTVWCELAPGESVEDLNYLDEGIVNSIRNIILDILTKKTGFVQELDASFATEKVKCEGDFRVSKEFLTKYGFSEKEQFDIFHVLMHEGGFCDCELLYNVFRDTEYSKKYRQSIHEQQ